MSLLTIVQNFCRRTGVIDAPSAVMSSTDRDVIQIRALLEEEGNDLSARGVWSGLTREALHTTLALEDQGAIADIADGGFSYIKNQTIWDRTDRLPVLGPESDVQWQTMKAIVVNEPRYWFRIRGNHMLVNPVPAAGHEWAFEYASKYWILGADGTTYKEFFTADDDVGVIPESLMLMGLRWRWKKEKGLDYAEDFRTYEIQVKNALGSDGGKPMLHMDSQGWRGPQPGVFIPSGSWAAT